MNDGAGLLLVAVVAVYIWLNIQETGFSAGFGGSCVDLCSVDEGSDTPDASDCLLRNS